MNSVGVYEITYSVLLGYFKKRCPKCGNSTEIQFRIPIGISHIPLIRKGICSYDNPFIKTFKEDDSELSCERSVSFDDILVQYVTESLTEFAPGEEFIVSDFPGFRKLDVFDRNKVRELVYLQYLAGNLEMIGTRGGVNVYCKEAKQ